MAAPLIDLGAWQLTGDFTTIDLIAASTNALNATLVTRQVLSLDNGRLIVETFPNPTSAVF